MTLNVPKELQTRLPSRTGKPTKRLQQSTGTDSLALARKRFPRIMADLQRRLLQASAANPESPDERMRFINSLKELGLKNAQTVAIKDFFFEANFPVDVRHNAKIHRLSLARKFALK